jgi:hypothetical protein
MHIDVSSLKNSIFWDISQKSELFLTTAVGISNRTTIYLIGIYAVETRKKKEV